MLLYAAWSMRERVEGQTKRPYDIERYSTAQRPVLYILEGVSLSATTDQKSPEKGQSRPWATERGVRDVPSVRKPLFSTSLRVAIAIPEAMNGAFLCFC